MEGPGDCGVQCPLIESPRQKPDAEAVEDGYELAAGGCSAALFTAWRRVLSWRCGRSEHTSQQRMERDESEV